MVVVTILRTRRASGSAAKRQLEQPAAAASEAARSGRPATAAGESNTSIPFIHCCLCSLCGCTVYGPLAAASSSRVQRHNGRERHFLRCARLAQRKARATQAHRRHKDSTATPYSKIRVLAAWRWQASLLSMAFRVFLVTRGLAATKPRLACTAGLLHGANKSHLLQSVFGYVCCCFCAIVCPLCRDMCDIVSSHFHKCT